MVVGIPITVSRWPLFVGLLTSAVDTLTGSYVELAPEDDFRVLRRFASLDEWYRNTLRAEYGCRYGLP